MSGGWGVLEMVDIIVVIVAVGAVLGLVLRRRAKRKASGDA